MSEKQEHPEFVLDNDLFMACCLEIEQEYEELFISTRRAYARKALERYLEKLLKSKKENQ